MNMQNVLIAVKHRIKLKRRCVRHGIALNHKDMKNKRMFSREIVRQESFLEMPQSCQNLYFHLGLDADDDGFVNPRATMRAINANKNDLDVLLAKKFVMQMSNGVVVVTDWRENNYIRGDRYTETLYKEEKLLLNHKDGRYYLKNQVKEPLNIGIPDGSTHDSLD